MLLKELLNQFELDWAEAPLREENLKLSKLNNKSVVVAGSSMLARAVAVSVACASDKKQLGINLFIYTDSPSTFDVLTDREDVTFVSTAEKLLQNPDYWIDADFLVSDEVDVVKSADMLRFSASRVAELSLVKPNKVILLSDNSVYGKLEKGYVISENENGNIKFDTDNLKSVLMQSVENMFFSASKQYSFKLNVLRCSNVICPFSNSDFVNSIVRAIAECKNLVLDNSRVKSSFISVNDFITAIFFVLLNGKGGAYNACSDNSTVSMPELAVIINDLFDKLDFSYAENALKSSGCAICNTKLKQLGFTPKVDIKDALLISAHAYTNSDKVFMFPDAYDGRLESVQKILLGFLLEIDRICKKHNIKYFLAGGTLLGAIRHQGFIPWDDDADVMMLREDYDKFLKILPSELQDNMFLQTLEKTSHFPFAKIRIKNTVFSTEFTSRFDNVHQGIFFDVLAQDHTSNSNLISKLHMQTAASSRWLVLNKWRGTKVDSNGRLASFVMNTIKKIFSLNFFEKMQNKLIPLFKNKKNAKWLYDSMGRNISRGRFPKKWLTESVLVDFEGYRLPVPKEYDKYLTYLYGDYMDMIPVSKRHVSHEIIQMDLGEYKDYQLKV